MRINREKIRQILDEQKRRDFMDSGYSPSLVYGCFYSLEVNNTKEVCENCRSYAHCKSYLEAVEIKLNPFAREQRQ